jgi:hypothetical protein
LPVVAIDLKLLESIEEHREDWDQAYRCQSVVFDDVLIVDP